MISPTEKPRHSFFYCPFNCFDFDKRSNLLAEFLETFGYSAKGAEAIAKEFKARSIRELKLKTKLTLAASQIQMIPKLPC